MKEEILEADVLCVGGGIAGLMAAIRAGELGAKVIVAEKANSLRSGAAGMGNDHFQCYIPEVHGTDVKTIVTVFIFAETAQGISISTYCCRGSYYDITQIDHNRVKRGFCKI